MSDKLSKKFRCKIKQQINETLISYRYIRKEEEYRRIKQRIKELDYELKKFANILDGLKVKCPSCDFLRKRFHKCPMCSIKRCKDCLSPDDGLCNECYDKNEDTFSSDEKV